MTSLSRAKSALLLAVLVLAGCAEAMLVGRVAHERNEQQNTCELLFPRRAGIDDYQTVRQCRLTWRRMERREQSQPTLVTTPPPRRAPAISPVPARNW